MSEQIKPVIRPLGNHYYEKTEVIDGKIVVSTFLDIPARMNALIARVQKHRESIKKINENPGFVIFGIRISTSV